MIKLISVTWSYEDIFNIENTFLYRSFIKHNDKENFYHIHFNRRNYQKLEEEFNNKFGYQYEFLLYRIFLLREELTKHEFDVIVFSDTNDVVCLSNLNEIKFYENKIIFSFEKHRYPNESNITNWEPNYKYGVEDDVSRTYLNAGLSIGTKDDFIKLFNECIEIVFPKEYKNFGGDQGVFTYHYLNVKNNNILLDKTNKYFLSTYSDSPSNYEFINGRIKVLNSNQTPIFIHDNGWDYGSPKFINHFKLI